MGRHRLPIPEMKQCKGECKQVLPIADFNFAKKRYKENVYSRPFPYCKSCHCKINTVNKNKRRDEVLKYHNRYNKKRYAENRDSELARAKAWYQANKNKN